MSKKNNRGTRARIHQHDLQKEKEAATKKALKLQKQQQQVASASGVTKKTKHKVIRIKKGVRVKGIKIIDAASKKKAKALLKAASAKQMDIDAPAKRRPKKRGAPKVDAMQEG